MTRVEDVPLATRLTDGEARNRLEKSDPNAMSDTGVHLSEVSGYPRFRRLAFESR
jgi:hypothetical protein